MSPRWCTAICLGALLALVSACSNNRSAEPAAAATAFLKDLMEDRSRQAYENATFAFQVQQSYPSFAASVNSLGFEDLASVNWTKQDVTASRATLEGELVNRSGARFPVIVALIREGGAWKVYSFRMPGRAGSAIADNPFSLMGRATAFNDASNRNLPAPKEIVTLVRETLQQFDSAVKEKDFANFYQFISVAWQAQLSEKRLQRAFQPFIDAGIDLRDTQTLDPIFDREPQIDATGLLVVNGYFPTQPYKLVFSLKYTYELPRWRLFGLNLNIVK